MKAGFQAEHYFAARSELAESPLWDAAHRADWWIDIARSQLHRLGRDSKKHSQWELPAVPGAVNLRAQGGMVLSLQSGFAGFDPRTANVELWGSPEPDRPDNRLNDSKCDRSGRLWAGTMRAADFMNQHCGSLYSLEADRRIRRHWGGNLGVSNGLAWSHDSRTMYFVDSAPGRIYRFRFDLPSGNLEEDGCLIEIPPAWGSPDGMTIDHQGKLWVALWGGGCVARICPQAGEIIERIQLPVSAPSSCAFTGPNLDELLITTAASDLSPEERRQQPLAGDLFICRLPWHGWPEPAYAG